MEEYLEKQSKYIVSIVMGKKTKIFGQKIFWKKNVKISKVEKYFEKRF